MALEAIVAVLGGVVPALLLGVLAIDDVRVGVVLDDLRAWARGPAVRDLRAPSP